MERPYTIGIDARLLSEPLAGIGRYTLEIVSRLVCRPHRWMVYSHSPLLADYFKGRDNVVVRHGHFSGRVGRQLWAQSFLPLWAARDRVDAFWCPAHRIPELLPRSIPALVTIHDMVWLHAAETMRPYSRFLDATLMPRALRRAQRIITVSSSTARDIISHMPQTKEKTSVIPLAGNFASGDEEKTGVPLLDMRGYFLFVGTLEPRKNLPRILEAYARLPEAEKSLHPLVVVGEYGWGRADIPALVKQYGLAPYVTLTGRLENNALRNVYRNAFALLLPSLYEGFGMPILEAMQVGVPVITANRSSMPEVAGDGGLLVDPTDSGAIADAMRRLIADPALCKQLSDNGFKQARRYSWDATAQETYRVIMEALAAGG